MEKLEKLRELALENKELEQELETICGASREEVIQKVIAAAQKAGLDLKEADFDSSEELILEDLDQVAGGIESWTAMVHDKKRSEKKEAWYFSVIMPK